MNTKHFEDRLPLLKQLGFQDEGFVDLKSYLDLLWRSNEDLNLISRKMTSEDLIDNHVIDCLLPLSHFPSDVHSIADFGSGGGLPGVLYAIRFPTKTFHLFEKSNLKREFLNECKKIAPNIEIHADIPSELPGIELVIARAFKPLDVLLDMSRAYCLSGGKYFLLKGRREKIEEETLAAKKKFKMIDVKVTPLKSPVLEVERHLLQVSAQVNIQQ